MELNLKKCYKELAVEELEERVLTHFFNVLKSVYLEELVVLLSVYLPWRLLEEKSLRLRLS